MTKVSALRERVLHSNRIAREAPKGAKIKKGPKIKFTETEILIRFLAEVADDESIEKIMKEVIE